VLALAGCGDDDGSSPLGGETHEGFDAFSISGELGTAPEVDWKGRLEADETETKVLIEGDGKEVADGDQVEVNVWIGNGFTQKEAYTTYADGGSPETFTVDDQLTPLFRDAILGEKLGSRVAVTTPASEVFGEQGNPRHVVKEGDGETVTSDMTVEADYLGMVYKGKKPFDESFSAEPAEFALNQVVPGWTYGLSGVKVGSRVLLAIPPRLGYGEQEQEDIPANSTLYFVVDIVSAK
jgi:peptidylprolyl isomerase